MSVSVYRPIKIKDMVTAKEFADSFKGGPLYIMGDKEDICLEMFKGEFSVATRPACGRGDVFFPYFMLEDPIKGVYKYRKYINRMTDGHD